MDVLALDEEAWGEDGGPLRVEAQVQAVGRGEVAVHRVHGPHEVRLRRVARRLVQQDQVRVAHRVEMPGKKIKKLKGLSHQITVGCQANDIIVQRLSSKFKQGLLRILTHLNYDSFNLQF